MERIMASSAVMLALTKNIWQRPCYHKSAMKKRILKGERKSNINNDNQKKSAFNWMHLRLQRRLDPLEQRFLSLCGVSQGFGRGSRSLGHGFPARKRERENIFALYDKVIHHFVHLAALTLLSLCPQ